MHDKQSSDMRRDKPPATTTGPPVVCSYLPTRLADEFDTMPAAGKRSWPLDDTPPKDRALVRSPSPLTTGRLVPRGLLILGHRAPGARVGRGEWDTVTLGRLVLGTIAGPTHDEDGLHVEFDTFFHAPDVNGRQLCPPIMEAMRLPANQWGRPVAVASWPALGVLARFIEHYPDTRDHHAPVHGELVTLLSRRAAELAQRTLGRTNDTKTHEGTR